MGAERVPVSCARPDGNETLGCGAITIRNRLRQQLTRLRVGACGVGIAVGLVHWPPVFWLLALFIFPVLAGTTIVVGMRFIRCPGCGVRLG
jgi:hypothetical protein